MSDTKTKFGFALACVLMATSIASSKENAEPTHLTLDDFVSKNVRLLDTKGKRVSRSVLRGKFVGVYFSAHWCSPCRRFTPKLQKFRDANNEDFEVVFLSLDLKRDNRGASSEVYLAKKKEYMESANMNWYTTDCGFKNAYSLYRKTGNRGIPNLIVFSPNGKYVTNDGKNDIWNTKQTALESWKTKVSDRK